MKKLMLIVVAALAVSTVAAEGKKINLVQRKTGGMILRPGVKQGSIAIFNAQKTVPSSEFAGVTKTLVKQLHVDMPVKDIDVKGGPGELGEWFRKDGANYGVFVVDCDKCDTALSVFPEKKFAVVNVNALKAEGGVGAFLKARTRKEVLRAILFVAGGASSQADGNLMSEIRTPRDLDKLVDDAIPVDVMIRVYSYLPRTGCENHAYVPYYQACKEGWAPQPTNDYQKAVWEKVHAPPSKPIKISYDKDKQKPVVK